MSYCSAQYPMNHVWTVNRTSQTSMPPANNIQKRTAWDPPKPPRNNLTFGETTSVSGAPPPKSKMAITCIPADVPLGDLLSHNQLAISLLRCCIGLFLVDPFLVVLNCPSTFDQFRNESFVLCNYVRHRAAANYASIRAKGHNIIRDLASHRNIMRLYWCNEENH